MNRESGLTAGDDRSNGVPDAKIPGNLRRDHCLGPCTAFNVMDGQAGEAHAAHQDGNFVARQCDFSTSRILNVFDSIVQCIVDGSATALSQDMASIRRMEQHTPRRRLEAVPCRRCL